MSRQVNRETQRAFSLNQRILKRIDAYIAWKKARVPNTELTRGDVVRIMLERGLSKAEETIEALDKKREGWDADSDIPRTPEEDAGRIKVMSTGFKCEDDCESPRCPAKREPLVLKINRC